MDQTVAQDYPWVKQPLISCAPMRLIALAPLAVAVSQASGLGFIGVGSDTSDLPKLLEDSRRLLSSGPQLSTAEPDVLPLGLGFLLWGASLQETLDVIQKPGNIPAAVWLFAPREQSDLTDWSNGVRKATQGKTKIWIQVACVAEAVSAVQIAQPDVLVIQGTDAGGHGGAQGAGLTALAPEIIDTVNEYCTNNSSIKRPTFVAAGGITDGRGVASSITLGCSGVTLGTRYLASQEANIPRGYQDAVLRTSDGGLTTIRSSVYDTLRGTTDWPKNYGGRGVINASYHDHQSGMSWEDNKRRYAEALKSGDKGWEGEQARLTTYAGTGLGLVKKVQTAADITREVREEGLKSLRSAADRVASL